MPVLVVAAMLGVLPVEPATNPVRLVAEQAGPCPPDIRACVALGARQAWLRDPGGRLTFGPVPIVPGSDALPTPVGRFSVLWKSRDHVSSLYPGVAMPFSVFFNNRGIAFHEGNMARPSAGCVKLERDAAARFFADLEVGASVQVVP